MVFEQENENLIKHIKSLGYLKSKKLENALKELPRHLFVRKISSVLAYRDIPLSIGYGQTISQPSTVVLMTEALDVKTGQKILEIGAGSGWQGAIIGKIVGSQGKVYTVERVPTLIEFAKKNLKKAGIENVKVIEGDGSMGLEKYAPFDRIIVTCACPETPKPLLSQLKTNGKIVIPLGNMFLQQVYIITKRKTKIEKKSLGFFAFVPLVGKHGFKEL